LLGIFVQRLEKVYSSDHAFGVAREELPATDSDTR
jgi:hypothetical protein